MKPLIVPEVIMTKWFRPVQIDFIEAAQFWRGNNPKSLATHKATKALPVCFPLWHYSTAARGHPFQW